MLWDAIPLVNKMHTIAAIKIQLEGDGIHRVKMNKSPTGNTLANAKWMDNNREKYFPEANVGSQYSSDDYCLNSQRKYTWIKAED